MVYLCVYKYDMFSCLIPSEAIVNGCVREMLECIELFINPSSKSL